jgi:hypothetical protein
MVRLEDVMGSFKELNSIFSSSRHLILVLPRVITALENFAMLDFLGTSVYMKTFFISSLVIFLWSVLKSSSSLRSEMMLL